LCVSHLDGSAPLPSFTYNQLLTPSRAFYYFSFVQYINYYTGESTFEWPNYTVEQSNAAIKLQASGRMWIARARTASMRRFAARQRRVRQLEERWYASVDKRTALVAFSVHADVTVASTLKTGSVSTDADPDADAGSLSTVSQQQLRMLPVWQVKVACRLQYTQECLRFGWCAASDEEKEAYGVTLNDAEEGLSYRPGVDAVYMHMVTKECTITRPVYGFWYVLPSMLSCRRLRRPAICDWRWLLPLRLSREYFGAVEFQKMWRGFYGRRTAIVSECRSSNCSRCAVLILKSAMSGPTSHVFPVPPARIAVQVHGTVLQDWHSPRQPERGACSTYSCPREVCSPVRGTCLSQGPWLH
jgi:hypothetical protein